MNSDRQPVGDDAGLRVLVVEDEYLVSLVLEDMLAELGHRMIGPVSDLTSAVAAAQRESMDVALLDLNLNGLESYPVAAALTARGIPFLFATGYGRQGLREPYLNASTLKKPFEQGELESALADVLAARDAGRADEGRSPER